MSNEAETTVVLEGEVMGEPAAEVMACEHAVSKMRVALVWELRERRSKPEHAKDGVCACCEMPCRPGATHCLVCTRQPFNARLPYGDSAR